MSFKRYNKLKLEMIKFQITTLLMLNACALFAQGPNVTSYMQNTTTMGTTQGVSNNILTNCQSVYYDATNVFVKSTSIPGYDIGPWPSNPNTASNQNKTWKLPINPVEKTGTKTKTGLGAIGIWINGVEVFNQKDGKYWNGTAFANGQGANWNRNALYYEGISFDACLGHPAPGGAYHLHVNPTCLYDDNNATVHSPIVGFAFDGFPIYGAYGYTNTNSTGAIKRMQSGYVLNTTRTGTPTPPPVNATYPLGCLCEDYTWTTGAGDLDIYNGRFCVTPEYPSGTYAYFITIDASGNPAYPFILGNEFYGTPLTTGQGNATIPTGATQYLPTPLGLNSAAVGLSSFSAIPNNGNVDILWSTAFEYNLNYYEVQKSKNTINWIKATDAKPNNTIQNSSYKAIDYLPYNGFSYYRLKVLGDDNVETFSDVVRVNLENQFSDARAYPNPFTTEINLITDGSLYNYKLINLLGMVVAEGSIRGIKTINTDQIQKGIYTLYLTNPVTEITKQSKLIKY
jgi:hypothetical protein